MKEDSMEEHELVIVGAGPAGLTAALYGKRAGLEVLVLEKGGIGGQILMTATIENWPGTISASGPELIRNLQAHVEHLKVPVREAEVSAIEPCEDGFRLRTGRGDVRAEAVIFACGAHFRHLGCPGEARFIGRGVSYCAVCDGAFFKDEEVAVIGGGNTAVEEANYLTQFASRVYLVHRRDAFRADRAVVEHTLANPKIMPVMDSVPEEIVGSDIVEKLVVKNVKSGALSDLPVSGVFIFVGQSPNSELVRELVRCDEAGWIHADEALATSRPCIFVAGDVRITSLRQVITAAADGARAAMSAYAYIDKLHAARKVH
jgi:thioredoxin reductase (NADPH)